MTRISQLQFGAIPQRAEGLVLYTPSLVSRVQSFAQMESLIKALDEVSYIESNWDGYGALPISTEAKRNALTALHALASTAPPPTVISNPNGTLSFEWETEQGVGNLEIGKTRYSFYVKTSSGRALLADGDADKIGSFLGTFVDGVLYPKPSEPAFQNLKFLAENV